jgi:hypothetical protein
MEKIAKWFGGLVMTATLLLAMAQTPSQTAKANLLSWVPDALLSPRTVWLGFATALVAFGWAYRGKLRFLTRLRITVVPSREERDQPTAITAAEVATLQQHKETLRRELSEALYERQEAKEALEVAKQESRDAADCREQLADMSHQSAAARWEARTRFELLVYGRELPDDLPTLAPATAEAVRMHLSDLGPLLSSMCAEALAMWLRVGADAHVMGESEACYWLHVYIGEREYYFAKSATQSFWEALKAKEDLRPALIVTCINYFNWRERILLLAELTGKPATTREGYAHWLDAERSFFDELRKKVATEDIGPVGTAIRAHLAHRHGVMVGVDLPTKQLMLPPSAPSTEARPSTESAS